MFWAPPSGALLHPSVSCPLPRPTGWLFLPAPSSPHLLYFSVFVPCCACTLECLPLRLAHPQGVSESALSSSTSCSPLVCWYLHFPWILSTTCWGLPYTAHGVWEVIFEGRGYLRYPCFSWPGVPQGVMPTIAL